MKKFATAAGTPPVLHRNTANLMQSMLDEVKASITILDELQAFIPALQPAEYKQLEDNIRQDGCREALLIWQTTRKEIDGSADDSPINVLIDGHNRYAICQKNQLEFKIMLREFPSMQAVRDFMIDNQLGRRNLTPEQISYLRGLKYRNERQATGRPILDNDASSREDMEEKVAQRTQDRLAKQFNISPRTIHRDREFSEGIDKLTPELKQEVLSGKQKVAKELVRSVGRTAKPDTPPLALPELLTFTKSTSSANASLPPIDKKEFAGLVKELAALVKSLVPGSPTFSETCDRIIQLTKEVKYLKIK